MKKILLSLVLVVICYLAFPGLTVSAAGSGSLWNRAMSGTLYLNDSVFRSFNILSIDVGSDDWGIYACVPLEGTLYFGILSKNPFSVTYEFYSSGSSSINTVSSRFLNGYYYYYFSSGSPAGMTTPHSADIPIFRGDFSSLFLALENQDPSKFISIPGPNVDGGIYDKDLGYLVGISERSSILDLLKDKDNTIGSDVEQFNRVFKIGWGSKTSTGVDLSGSDKYEDLQVQAKIKVYGHFVSSITGDLTRGIPDVDDYHDFDYIPADSYSMRFELLDDLQFWFIDFFNYVYSDAKFLEKPVVMADLFLRVFGTDLNDDLCVGPWVKVSFYVMNGVGKSDTHVVVTGGDEFDDDGNLVVDSSSPYGDGLSTDFGYGSGFTESDAYNNLIRDSENRLNVTFESLMKDVGNLPAIISKLFSFLPSWCLSLLSLAFSLSIVILIWKVAT